MGLRCLYPLVADEFDPQEDFELFEDEPAESDWGSDAEIDADYAPALEDDEEDDWEDDEEDDDDDDGIETDVDVEMDEDEEADWDDGEDEEDEDEGEDWG